MKTALCVLGLLLALGVRSNADAGYKKVVAASLPKTVSVYVRGYVDDYASPTSTATVRKLTGWLGAGAFISPDGYILTCGHLFVRPLIDREILVKTSSGHAYRAALVDYDFNKDLALLKVFPFHPQPYFTFGHRIARGQLVIAIGTPLGIPKTVSVGYIQNINVKDDETTNSYTMHSAAINPGNSGGPLIDEFGYLVGVNVMVPMLNPFQRADGMAEAIRLRDIHLFLGE